MTEHSAGRLLPPSSVFLLGLGFVTIVLWFLTGWLCVFWGNVMTKELDVAHGAILLWMRLGPSEGWSYESANHGLNVAWKPFQWSLVPIVRWWDNTLTVILPLWCVSALCLGAGTFLAWKAGSRTVGSLCAQCRYDLTGNVSGRCPECGAAIRAPNKRS
jgi:hypothetical protein